MGKTKQNCSALECKQKADISILNHRQQQTDQTIEIWTHEQTSKSIGYQTKVFM